MSSQPSKARWVFAWLPVKTEDTKRWIWLRKVYRERWGETLYWEEPVKF